MASFGGYSLIGAALLAVGLVATALAQPPAPAAAPPAALTAEERTRAEQVILSDRRVRELVGSGQPRIIATPVEPDKAEAEAFLEGRSGAAPPRRIAVVVFDVRANRAARALVALPENRVVSVQRLAATDVPFGRADAEDALALARQDAAVRRAVGDALDRYEILDSGSAARVPYAAQLMPLRNVAPNDPCRVNRCAVLLFRTETGYLPVSARVDLTRRTVQLLEARRQHR
jgi:hypothetical protein